MSAQIVQELQDEFAQMLRTCYSVLTVQRMATLIRARVADGTTSWDELGFTAEQVTERLCQAKIREARTDFAQMLRACYSALTVGNFATKIRDWVADGATSWDELGFTDEQVAERLRQAEAREAS